MLWEALDVCAWEQHAYEAPSTPYPTQRDETHLLHSTATREVRWKDWGSGYEAENPTKNLTPLFTPDVPKSRPYPWIHVDYRASASPSLGMLGCSLFPLSASVNMLLKEGASAGWGEREKRWEGSGRRAAHPLGEGKLDVETWPSQVNHSGDWRLRLGPFWL